MDGNCTHIRTTINYVYFIIIIIIVIMFEMCVYVRVSSSLGGICVIRLWMTDHNHAIKSPFTKAGTRKGSAIKSLILETDVGSTSIQVIRWTHAGDDGLSGFRNEKCLFTTVLFYSRRRWRRRVFTVRRLRLPLLLPLLIVDCVFYDLPLAPTGSPHILGKLIRFISKPGKVYSLIRQDTTRHGTSVQRM